MSRQPLKPWLVMALIFVIGAVTGAALTFGFRSDWMHPPGEQQLRARWLLHLTERLGLTPDQQAKIQPILDDAGDKIQRLHRDEVDRMSRIMQEANDKISPLLTPQQQVELKQMESERRTIFSHHLHGHHEMDGSPNPPAPPPPNS